MTLRGRKEAMARVIFLDDNEDLRLVMVSLIESRLNVSCLGLSGYADMLTHSKEVLSSEAIILDLDLGYKKPSGIDVYNWLKAHDFRGSIHFLTGHGRAHPLMREAEKCGAKIWEKPSGSTEIIALIGEKLRRPREANL